jgi:hypothetical protein
MLSPFKRVLSQYRTLLLKMYTDQFIKPTISAAKVDPGSALKVKTKNHVSAF